MENVKLKEYNEYLILKNISIILNNFFWLLVSDINGDVNCDIPLNITVIENEIKKIESNEYANKLLKQISKDGIDKYTLLININILQTFIDNLIEIVSKDNEIIEASTKVVDLLGEDFSWYKSEDVDIIYDGKYGRE